MKLVILALTVLISGCTTVSRILDFGAAANEEAVKSSIFVICQGSSIGAVRRSFDTPEKVETWKRLCNSETEFEL